MTATGLAHLREEKAMKTVFAKTSAIAFLAGIGALPALAQINSAGGSPPALAKQLDPARGGTRLSVTSAAVTAGLPLEERFSQNGENRSPPISWTKGPAGTLSYAVLLEDANVTRPEPVAHWVVYDIPGTVDHLSENQPKQSTLDMGALQGRNVGNEAGFIGPKPPAGETHSYHMQVFALNTRLKLDPEKTERNDVVRAMKGHVLASGDLIATYTGK
jgi:Raf kinase inhibitor-like YbhB/YbcL family protein